jgi:hypothetical protein
MYFIPVANLLPHRASCCAPWHRLRAPQHRCFPRLNLHSARIRRNHGRPRPNGFTGRAQNSPSPFTPHRERASGKALTLTGTWTGFYLRRLASCRNLTCAVDVRHRLSNRPDHLALSFPQNGTREALTDALAAHPSARRQARQTIGIAHCRPEIVQKQLFGSQTSDTMPPCGYTLGVRSGRAHEGR